jgi:ABC-type uncharacterized transport system auxiliary subunit
MHEAWEHATAEENWNQRVVQILVAGQAEQPSSAGQVVLVALEDDQLVLHKDGEWADSLVIMRPIALAFWNRYKLRHLPSVDAWKDKLQRFINKFPPRDERDEGD